MPIRVPPACHTSRPVSCARSRLPATCAIQNCPNVPTVVEAGFPKLQSPFWLAVVAPAGTPRDIIIKLNSAFRDALAAPQTRARLDTLGAEVKIGTPEDLEKMLARERAQWTALVKAANIVAE